MRSEAVLTEAYFDEHLPNYLKASASDIKDAFKEINAITTELAGPRGEFASKLYWPVLAERTDAVAVHSVDGGIHYISEGVIQSLEAPITFDGRLVDGQLTTGDGSVIAVRPSGEIVAAANLPNEQVSKAYGSPDPYMLEKLTWAHAAEVLTGQGGDWGEGYVVLTDFLRSVGRIGAGQKPHIGMATVHLQRLTNENRGKRRVAAYASASNYTLSEKMRRTLELDRGYAARKAAAIADGSLTNESDFCAGLIDTRVAYIVGVLSSMASSGGEKRLARDFSLHDFPAAADQGYLNVDIH